MSILHTSLTISVNEPTMGKQPRKTMWGSFKITVSPTSFVLTLPIVIYNYILHITHKVLMPSLLGILQC